MTMENDPNPLPPPPIAIVEPPVPAPARPRKVVCEFCECELSPAGEVLRRGEKARVYLDIESDLDTEKKVCSDLRAENTRLATRINELEKEKKGKLW
jgi:hypothetical protein